MREIFNKLLVGDYYQNSNIVFSTQICTYINPRNFMRSFYRLTKKAGISKANVHCLRHTFATRMLELGENPRVVQEILGHKNITQTLNTYTYVLDSTKKLAICKINTLINSMTTKSIVVNTNHNEKLPNK